MSASAPPPVGESGKKPVRHFFANLIKAQPVRRRYPRWIRWGSCVTLAVAVVVNIGAA